MYKDPMIKLGPGGDYTHSYYDYDLPGYTDDPTPARDVMNPFSCKCERLILVGACASYFLAGLFIGYIMF